MSAQDLPWWVTIRSADWWAMIKQKTGHMSEEEKWVFWEWKRQELAIYNKEKRERQERDERIAAEAPLYPKGGPGVGGGPWPFDYKRAVLDPNYRGYIAQAVNSFLRGEDYKGGRRYSVAWLLAATDLYENVKQAVANVAGFGEEWKLK